MFVADAGCNVVGRPGPNEEQFVTFLPDNPHVKFFDSRLRGYVVVQAPPRRMKRRRWRRHHSEPLHDFIVACLSGLLMAVFAKGVALTTWSEAIVVWLVFSATLYFGLRSNSNSNSN
jgi:hypothetical protein